MWTMSHGALIGAGATVVQVDLEPEALGRHRPIKFGVVGDVAATAAAAVAAALPRRDRRRLPHRRRSGERIAARHPLARRADRGPFDAPTASTRACSARRSTTCCPAERIVATDSGNFQGYPSAYLAVPDEFGFCMTQAYQSIGLGLATTIGAALAQPDRLPVAALGDGGALMGVERAGHRRPPRAADGRRRLRRRGLRRRGPPLRPARPRPRHVSCSPRPTSPPSPAGSGSRRDGPHAGDLDAVRRWVDGPRDGAAALDAKVVKDQPSWWLEEAFRGH